MELKTDVFITHDPKDSAKVEPWVVALKSGGLGVWYVQEHGLNGKGKAVASQALEQSRLVIFFLSASSLASEAAFQEVMLARQMKKPVIVVALETLEVADGWRSLLRDAPMIDIRQDGRRAAWEGLQQVLQEKRIKWVDPELRRPGTRENVRRTGLRRRRWVTGIVIFWVVVLLGYFGFIRSRVPTAGPVAPDHSQVSTPRQDDLPMTPIEEVKVTPVPDLMKPMDALQMRAVEHVRSSIASANREHGLDEAHINRIVSYFAEPAWIQDRGKQDRNGLKAYMTMRQIEWPRWLELVESVDVFGQEGENVRISVRSSFLAGNRDNPEPITGVLNTRYTIAFASDGAPSIVRVEGAAERPTD